MVSSELLSQPCEYCTTALRIFPNCAATSHQTRLAHQGVAGVGEGQPIKQPGAPDHFLQRLRLFQGRRGRLVAHHMEAMLQGGHRDGQVEMIRGDDADKVDGIFPLALPLHHLFIICIGAVGAYAVGHACLARSFRILTEGSGHQLDGSIQLGRHAMYGTDKRARATTNHPHPKTSTLAAPSLSFALLRAALHAKALLYFPQK